MDDSGYYTRGVGDFEVCSPPDSAHHIFSLKFSDLPGSQYNCFLHGFKDEQDFEEFKQDLRDFQKLKREFVCRFVDGGDDGGDELIDLTELQFICKNNYVCKSRRGCASRSARPCGGVLVVPVTAVLRLSPTVVPAGLSTADTTCHSKAPLNDGPRQALHDPLAVERPGSLCRTSHVGVTASSLGCDKSDELELSISDILMEFLNEDEHFLEFEQVFEAVRNRRISREIDTGHMSHIDTGRRMSSHLDTGHMSHVDTGRRMSSHLDTDCRMSSNMETGAYSRLDSPAADSALKDVQQSSQACDIFADFFDNDESFLEFEKEFERFRSGRRSCWLENGHDLSWADGAFSHLNVRGDQEARSDMSSSPCSQNEVGPHRPSACSVKDWTKMIRKIRRSSCISMDSGTDRRIFQHRYSVGGMSEDSQRKDEQHTAHSVSDLRRFHKHESSPSSSQQLISQREIPLRKPVTSSFNMQPSSQSQQDTLTSEPDLWLQTSATRTRDEPQFADNGNDPSTGQSSAVSEDPSRPSSPGHCCSSSCFCQSDLFIEEACDYPQITSEPPHSSPVRSFSLTDLGSQAPVTDFRLHTNSLDSFGYYKRRHGSGSPLAGSLLQRISYSHAKYTGDGDLDDSLSVSTPSASCSHLSCADSEHYQTATSDLSAGYSTAKSNLSLLIDRLESAVIDQRGRLDTSGEPAPNSDSSLSDYTFDPADTQQPGSITRDQYQSCTYRDDWPACRDKRPRSSPACQYTCHEHCVPSVTLSCKSVSGDGCDIAAAKIPSPSDPRSHGDACLFMGNIQARPGAARIVSGHTADTPALGAARTSESVPNFQHLAPGRGVAGHMDTPRPFNILSHHRSWSISEDIVTPHSGLIQHPGVMPDPARRSPAPHTSSPHCQPSYSDSHFDSFPRGNACRQSELHAGVPRAESHCVGEVVGLSQHSKGGDRPAGDAPALDLPDVYRRDEDTSAATEKDETDSGYRSGTIPDDKLPRVASQATLDQQELQRKVTKYNHFVPAACLEVTGKESFQGFMKVTMNLIRPITMELGARPPSIYELLTREHIVEENTQHVAFYMPRDTHKSLHITSDTTTKEVIASLLKKFHILDHPRKFAMYEQEFSDRNKLVRLRRLTDKDCPLRSMVNWDPERIKNYRMVLQENETGEIMWEAFSLPELNNFMRVLDREEKETVKDLKHKYAFMRQYMERRLVELRGESTKRANSKT